MNTLVTREDLAKIIWGEYYISNYSDYAIDKHIANLRKKLIALLPNFEIKTIKGKGVITIKKFL